MRSLAIFAALWALELVGWTVGAQAPTPADKPAERLQPTENQRLRLIIRYKDAELLRMQAQQALAEYANEAERVKSENISGVCKDADFTAGKCTDWRINRVQDVLFDPNNVVFTRVPASKPPEAKPPAEPKKP